MPHQADPVSLQDELLQIGESHEGPEEVVQDVREAKVGVLLNDLGSTF
jgi:hypothetical protein